MLKFERDRQNWLRWLFEAKKRFGLRILNYIITSNHIHLLVVDDGERDVIPRSIQLIAGRTGPPPPPYRSNFLPLSVMEASAIKNL